jgi:hypothetical protein
MCWSSVAVAAAELDTVAVAELVVLSSQTDLQSHLLRQLQSQ